MTIASKIRLLADQYATNLRKAIDDRVTEMNADDISHYLIYRVLGVETGEGRMIDLYQNKGRFLYKYAGSFLEEATKLCFKETFPDSGSLRVHNSRGLRPNTFEIDCLVERMRLRLSGRTLRQMVTTSPKSTRDYR